MQGSFSTTKSDAGLSFCSVSTVRYVTEKIFKSALQSIKSHQYSFIHAVNHVCIIFLECHFKRTAHYRKYPVTCLP